MRQDMHTIWHQMVEQPLMVGDDQGRERWATQGVDAVGDDLQRVDVQATVGFIQDRQLGAQDAPSAALRCVSSRRPRSRH